MRHTLAALAPVLLAGCFQGPGPGRGGNDDGRPADCKEYVVEEGSTGLVCLALTVRFWDGVAVDDPLLGPSTADLAGGEIELRDPLDPLVVIDVDQVDDLGQAIFLLEPPFRVYATVEAPGIKRSYWLSQLVTDAWAALGRTAHVVSLDGWSAVHAAAGRAEDPAAGVILGGITSYVTSGFTIALSSGGDVLYTTGGALDPAATATETGGLFYVFGVPPGYTTVTATDGVTTFTTELRVMPDSAHVIDFHESDSW